MKLATLLLVPAVVVALLSTFTTTGSAAEAKGSIKVSVDGMVCGSCAQSVESAFKKNESVEAVYASSTKKMLLLSEKESSTLTDKTIQELVKKAGYKATEIERVDESFDAVKTALTAKKS